MSSMSIGIEEDIWIGGVVPMTIGTVVPMAIGSVVSMGTHEDW